MSRFNQDLDYATKCSEKTLQTVDEGFFLKFAENLAEIAGEFWIEKCFGKLKNDNDKFEILYKHEPVKNALIEVLSNVQQIYRKKSSAIATARIKEAEKLQEKNDLFKSLALYSQAVLRSQKTELHDCIEQRSAVHNIDHGENKEVDGGNTLSLALFGRSKVLIDINRYDLALADIQMALKENLPDYLKGEAFFKLAICYKAVNEEKKTNVALRLAQKLLNMKTEILMRRFHNESMAAAKFQEKIDIKGIDPKLSGKPNKLFPNAADTLVVKETLNLGRHVVCKGRIKSGDTLVVEAPYAACLIPEAFGTYCQHCFKRLTAPVGCPTCSNVAFCNLSCRNEALATYHKYECKILELLLGSGVSPLCYLALRMVTQKELEHNLKFYKNRKNEHVFSLCTNRVKRNSKDFFRRTVMASFLLRCLQKVEYFDTENSSVIPTEKSIIIGEMLLFNLQMLQFNAHEIYEKIYPETHRFKGTKINHIGLGLYPTVALFNHQCYPAVTRYFMGKNIVINAIRPLNDGELVGENYGPIFTKKPLVVRKKFLNSRYWFDCQCPACVQNWPMPSLETEDMSIRFRYPKKKSVNVSLLPNNEEQEYSNLNVMELGSPEKQLEECINQYRLAQEKMNEMHPLDSIEILKNALDMFHEIALPPHRETHLAEDTLRACYADFGNTFEVPANK